MIIELIELSKLVDEYKGETITVKTSLLKELLLALKKEDFMIAELLNQKQKIIQELIIQGFSKEEIDKILKKTLDF